jgi:uncharacterized repeat protein (TIGR03803 family)
MNKRYLFFALLALSFFSIHAQVTDILSFNDTTGSSPLGSLVLSGKTLYGTTEYGGLNGYGCVFAIDTGGTNYRDLLDFSGPNGQSPRGSLILANGRLYGTASRGGAGFEGCVFSIDTGGNNYKDLLDFNSENGGNPWGSLLLLGSQLYGLSNNGGARGVGCIFTVDTNGNNYQDLFDFTGINGRHPYGDLTLVGTKFFGMTYSGGTNDNGNIFSIDTNGQNYADLVDFNYQTYPQGSFPYGGLSYSNGVLYGMTSSGGANNKGIIFSVDTNGSGFVDLLDFNGTNGASPTGSLLLVDSILYGVTASGGSNSAGNIFSIDTAGNNFSQLAQFNDTAGKGPAGSLILANGILYGTAYEGGANAGSYGAVFGTSAIACNLAAALNSVQNVACYGANTGIAVASVSGGTYPFSFQWSSDIQAGDTANALVAGVYTVTITDNSGCSGSASATITQPSGPLTILVDSVKNEACHGDSAGIIIAVAAGGTSPYTYQWSVSGIVSDTAQGLASGPYSVTVTDNAGCSSTTAASITQPDALSVTSDSVAQVGSSCNGSAWVKVSGGTMPYRYLWQTNQQTTDSIGGQCAGTYCCFITDTNGCILNTCVTVNLSSGISTPDEAFSLHIYPEPSTGYFTIEGLSAQQLIEIYDYSGQKLNSEVCNNNTMHFDLSNKANGIYLIRILSKDASIISEQKLVKVQ